MDLQAKNSRERAKSWDRAETGQTKKSNNLITTFSIENLKGKITPQQLSLQAKMAFAESKKASGQADFQGNVQQSRLIKRGNNVASKSLESLPGESETISSDIDSSPSPLLRSREQNPKNPKSLTNTATVKFKQILIDLTLSTKPNNNSAIEICFKTQAGSLPEKPVKTNQDSYIIIQNYGGEEKNYFFAVCDGHGSNGHHASAFVKQHLPRKRFH